MKLSHCHILVILCLGFANLAFGTTYYVSTSGDDVNGTGSPSNPFKTIQHGIDSSTNGDTVIAQQGTYVENIDFLGKAITVRGSDPNNWETVAATIIDGSNGWAAFAFYSSEGAGSVLEGLTIRNGEVGVDGGDDGSPVINKCIIENNNVYGIVSGWGSPTITNNIIRDNSYGIWIGSYGGGEIRNNIIFNNDWGMSLCYLSVSTNNTVINNEVGATYFDSYTYCEPVIKNCIFWGNGDDLYGCTATYSCISDGDSGRGNISIDPCFVNNYHIDPNSPCVNGGDPCGSYAGQKDIDNEDRVYNNHVDMGADEVMSASARVHKIGGGWYDSISSAVTDANDGDVIEVLPGVYYENIDYGGKAITIRGSDPNNWETVAATRIDGNNSGDVVKFTDYGYDRNYVLEGVIIRNSGATSFGIFIDGDSHPLIRNCIVENNHTGIRCESSGPTITNNIIRNNSGSGLWIGGDAQPTIKNNLIYKNYRGMECEFMSHVTNNTIVNNQHEGIISYYGYEEETLIVENCIIWGNGDDLNGCNATYSCIKDVNDANGVGNITSDPCFADTASYDYHLKANSLCINAGNPDSTGVGEVDIDGQSRVQGGRIDMGADEDARVHIIGGGWYNSISSAITDASDGDVIEVFPGIYYENVSYDGKAITIRGSDPNNWPTVATTIIDGNNSGDVVSLISEEGLNSVLEGLTIRNSGASGAGVACQPACPTIRKCKIENNNGNGINCLDDGSVITNNIIANNSGTAIMTDIGGYEIKNNIIFNNGWGVMLNEYSSATITNNTIVYNLNAGIYFDGTGELPIIKNCIIWGNGDDLINCDATYSCIKDVNDANGIGNISSYPYFANYNNNDFHLTWNSPCLDKGDPNDSYTGQTDIDGEARVYNSRCDIGADELGEGVNLLANPGFEGGGGGWTSSGQTIPSIPLYWQNQWSSTSKTIDSAQKHSGSYSWKFYNSVTTKYSGAYSDFVPKTNGCYKLSAWAKSQNGTEPAYLGTSEWDQIDYTSNNINWSFVQYFLSNAKVPTEWTKYTYLFSPRNTSSPYFRVIFFGPCEAAGTVWWDDFSLIDLGPNFLYLPPYGASNEPNIAETINFGEDTNINWVANLDAITSVSNDVNDSNIKYRSIKAWETLTMEFPAFNDANGFPLTPMLLEIMYKDTTQSTDAVSVYSFFQYVDLDPNYNISDPNFRYELIHLGGSADNKWKYVQYAFQKSEYQLLRAIDGKYVIKIISRNTQVPIDYVSLRKISDEEYLALTNKQRELRGFYEVQLPADTPASPPDYNDLTVYVRDMMKPVYRHTKPAASEIISDINAVSAWGLVEPVSFAIYSQNGISNLTVEVSDLIHSQDANSVIPKENISVLRVVYTETRLAYNSNAYYKVGYALMPDYLKDFTTLSIDPNSSERIWISIKVPQSDANLCSGLYEGTITIKQNGDVLKNIQLDLDVLDVTLDKSEHMNTTYHDPTSRIYSSTDLSSVLKLYAETGMEPFIGWGGANSGANGRIVLAREPNDNDAIKRDANGIADFNTTAFEEAIDRMKVQGCLADKMHIVLNRWYELEDVYYAAFGIYLNEDDPNLYAHLSNETFVKTYKKLLNTYKQIGDDPNRNVTFIFHVGDEPGESPHLRIFADRLYNIIRDCNYLSGVTYYTVCDSNLHIDPNIYILPVALDHNLPALTDLIDYKTWAPYYEDTGYSNHNDPNYYGEFGYYTTGHSHWRNPAYNRFLHGLFAFGTDATVVAAYAMGDYVGDPYNDFDADASYAFPFTYPDFLYAYPTWSGKLYPTIGGIEGIREGIKDARYIATLKRLINEHPGTDANDAQAYLNNLKNRIDPNLMSGYYNKRTELGYAQEIFSHISDSNDPNDFEAFTKVRETVIDYIKKLLP